MDEWVSNTVSLLHASPLDMGQMARQLAAAGEHGISDNHPVLQRLQRRISNQTSWVEEAEFLLSNPSTEQGDIRRHMAAAAKYHVSQQAPVFKRLTLREYNHSLIPVMREEAQKLLALPLSFMTFYKAEVEQFAVEADHFDMPEDIMQAAAVLTARLKTAEACMSLSQVLGSMPQPVQ